MLKYLKTNATTSILEESTSKLQRMYLAFKNLNLSSKKDQQWSES